MSLGVGIVTTALSVGLDTLLIKPQRSVGTIVMQAVISESHSDELQITDHPVEKGASISDHAFKLPAEVTIVGAFSNSPSVSGLIDGIIGGLKATFTGGQELFEGKAPQLVTDVYQSLLKLQAQAVPFDIYTGKRKYSNMLLKSISTTTDRRTENSLEVTLQCREVLIVSATLVSVPADKANQATPQVTQAPVAGGAKSLQPGSNFIKPTGAP